MNEQHALVVGGFGALGSAVSAGLSRAGLRVLRTSRRERPERDSLVLDESRLEELPILSAVCWAQGINVNDSIETFDDDDLERLLEVNVTSVARQMRGLLNADRIADGAGLVVIGSIWAQIARPGKFSYTVTKAAVGGLVRAAAMDLAPRGIRVNAVLPGVVDTAMTRTVLTDAQQSSVRSATGHGRMIREEEVAAAVVGLATAVGSGITAQSVVVDLGFTSGRII